MIDIAKLIFKHLLLVLVAILSFYTISPYEFHQSGVNHGLPVYQILFPGIAFTIFMVAVQTRLQTFVEILLCSIGSIITYGFAFVVSMSSWGLAVPFCGGFGALIVKNLFFSRSSLTNFSSLGILFTISGFVSSMIGLILFYVLNLHPAGYGFGIIIVLWQVAIGVLSIWQARIKDNRS